MLPIKRLLLTNKNRPKKKLKKLKGIVIHWTANEDSGANALANRNYFNNTNRPASAHYIVDDHQIIQCIPDDEVAYHVGARKYRADGIKILESPYGPNYFLIGIEMCVNKDGVWSKTYQNTINLVVYLLKKYSLTVNDLYRHYDITGKNCPKMMLEGKDWENFRNDVQLSIDKSKIKSPEENKQETKKDDTKAVKGISTVKLPELKRLLKLTNPLLKGEDIKILQSRLKQLGYAVGNIDGIFGKKTLNAVNNFQQDKKLLVDGIVGPITWKALFK
jgi:N-acetylmuramoyl-L-alanine amidase